MEVFDWDERPELNITPLVDVMLVLLAILMVIAPNIVYEEMINLPQGSAQKQIDKKAPIHISIDEDGEITFNKEKIKAINFADTFFRKTESFDKTSTVMISADRTLKYGLVMSVLASVKRAGFGEVSLATSG